MERATDVAGTCVAVSGITGFIGAHVAANLLHRGYTVHGTLRRDAPERTAHLPTDARGTLRVFEADLLRPGAFDAATQGCTYALHVAGPYRIGATRDARAEVVDPVVRGTRNFLQSCVRAGVQKVVLTSSFAAVAARAKADGSRADERDWADGCSPSFLPYNHAKVLAEREAWDVSEAHGVRLVALNPVAVVGPSLTREVGQSAATLVQLARGDFGGVIDLSLPFVDVRDVADAHVRAMECATATGRYICAPRDCMLHLRDLSSLLRAQGLSPPTRDLTNPVLSRLIRSVSRVVPGGTAGQIASLQLGRPVVPCAEKVVRDLGVQFRPAEQAVRDTIGDLINWGHLKGRTHEEVTS